MRGISGEVGVASVPRAPRAGSPPRARAGPSGAPPRDTPTVGWRMPNRLKITSRATTGDPRVAAISMRSGLNPNFFLTPRGSASRPRANGFFHLGVHLGFAWTLNRARSVRECGAAPPAAAHPLGRGRGRGAAAADLACACDGVRPAAEASPPARPRERQSLRVSSRRQLRRPTVRTRGPCCMREEAGDASGDLARARSSARPDAPTSGAKRRPAPAATPRLTPRPVHGGLRMRRARVRRGPARISRGSSSPARRQAC